MIVGDDTTAMTAVRAAMTTLGAKVDDVDYERRLDDGKKRVVVTFEVKIVDTLGIARLIDVVEAVPGVRRVHVQHRL